MNADREQEMALARAVHAACVAAAEEAWEQGGMSGLCLEGRWDLALDRVRNVDLDAVLDARARTNP